MVLAFAFLISTQESNETWHVLYSQTGLIYQLIGLAQAIMGQVHFIILTILDSLNFNSSQLIVKIVHRGYISFFPPRIPLNLYFKKAFFNFLVHNVDTYMYLDICLQSSVHNFVLFSGAGNGTQDLTHTGQLPYHGLKSSPPHIFLPHNLCYCYEICW